LDGLEILSAMKHSNLATELEIDTKNLNPEELKKAYDKEMAYYTGKLPIFNKFKQNYLPYFQKRYNR
jgi:hypothetical protein